MKVSNIITTYNNSQALKKALDSILIQTRPPDEVIVADDGSGSDSAGLIESFADLFPFPVFHVWQENRGFRAAKIRNEAIKKSSGDYIILLDGDCVVNRHFIADHLALAEEGCFIQGKRVLVSREIVASFDHKLANSTTALIKLALEGRISNVHHLFRLPYYFSNRNRTLKGIKSCNLSFFKKDVIAVNGFNEDFIGWGSEDSDLACRFFKYGLLKKVHQFMAICFHLWHPTNKNTTRRNEHLLASTISSQDFFCKNGLIKED